MAWKDQRTYDPSLDQAPAPVESVEVLSLETFPVGPFISMSALFAQNPAVILMADGPILHNGDGWVGL